MTDKSAAAIREFAEKWCLKVIEVMKGDDYIMHDLDGCLSDLTALISEHYVSKEDVDAEVERRIAERIKEVTRYDLDEFDDGVMMTPAREGVYVLYTDIRSRLTNPGERKMKRDWESMDTEWHGEQSPIG